MLILLSGNWRIRAVAILVALYGLCVASPVTALALNHSSTPAQSLSDDHHGIGNHHEDGTGHQHPGLGDGDYDEPGTCCGLFCLSAIAPAAFDAVGVRLLLAADVAMPVAENLLGYGSNRIDRPPRFLLSL
jgi:hypothetical protein